MIAFALVLQVNWFSGKPCVSKTAGFRARCIGGIPRTGPRLCVLRKSAGFQPCGGGAEKNARVQSVLRRFAPSRSCPAPAPRCVTEIGGFPATRRRLRQNTRGFRARIAPAAPGHRASGHDRASRSHCHRATAPRPRPRCRSLDTGTKKKRDGKTRRALKMVGGLMLIDFPQPLSNSFFVVLEILRPSPTDGHNMLATTPQRRRETMH